MLGFDQGGGGGGASLPPGALDDIAAAKASAAAAKAATDALALRETANEQGDVAQGTAIASNGARLLALENAKATDEATLAAHGTRLGTLEAAKTADEAAISAHGGRLNSLETSRAADEATLAALQARPALPAGAPTKAGQIPVVQGDGSYALATPVAPAGGGVETYISSVQLTASSGAFDFAGSVPTSAKGNKATKVVVECVGGGSSGYCSYSVACHGGNPGQVTRRKLRVSEVPASVVTSIGGGGTTAYRYGQKATANGGTATSFGSLLSANGGGEVDYASTADNVGGANYTPGDVPSGRAGRAGSATANADQSTSQDVFAAAPSMGPGGGGAGIFGANIDYGGHGGDAAVHLPNSTRFGGHGGQFFSGPAAAGQSAIDVWGYGAGGGGGNTADAPGGAGGFPGGGGGGGPGVGGPGGNGVIRLHFYVDE